MIRRDWKRVRPTSLVSALRLCKEYALERRNLSVERIADLMGATHDSLYKWLATGKLPAIFIPAYEHACGAHFASEWLATSAGRLVIAAPTGRKVTETDLIAFNNGAAQAFALLGAWSTDPTPETAQAACAALQSHLQQTAWHKANVERHAEPQFDFTAEDAP